MTIRKKTYSPWKVSNNIVNLKNTNFTVGEIPFNNNSYTPTSTQEGMVWWNDDDKTLNISTGQGPIIQTGLEDLFIVANNTGSTITNGSVVYPLGGTLNGRPLVDLANANTHEKISGGVGIATMDIPTGTTGFVTTRGVIRGLNTVGFNQDDILWVSATTDGAFTNIKPEFPNYAIQLGQVTTIDAVDGEITALIDGAPGDTLNNTWDGSIRESIRFTASSNGTTITGSLENQDDTTRDLTLIFSDGFTIFDTTPPVEVTLTAGSATVPQTNYVYIDKATKTLQASTSDWPTTEEHVKIAQIAVLTAAITQENGTLRNQNWNDHVKSVDDNGHLLHITERLRLENAKWDSGVEGSVDIGAGGEVWAKNTSGIVYQLHRQNFPILDMTQYTIDAVSAGSQTFTISGDGDLTSTFPDGRIIKVNDSTGNDGLYTIASTSYVAPDFVITVEESIPNATADGTIGDVLYVVNDFTANYSIVTDLSDITTDASGNSLNNTSFSVVFWGVNNKTGTKSDLMANMPVDTYNKNFPEQAVQDANNYSVYSIPKTFQGVGFLIMRATFVNSGGIWTVEDIEDLRGAIPNTTAGGGAGGTGVTTFLGLTDTPSAYTSQGNKVPKVNSGETALEFSTEGLFYENDGTLSGNRTVTGSNGNFLVFKNEDLTPTTWTERSIIVLDESVGSIAYETGDGLGGTSNQLKIQLDATGGQITDSVNSKGLEYVADYSTNFVDRSLIDKAYSDEYSFYLSNGTITDSARLADTFNNGRIEFGSFDSTDASASTVYGSLVSQSASTGFSMVTLSGGIPSAETSILINSSGNMLVTDNINSKGLVYNSDYSANFTDRSLIDKAYSDTNSFYKSDGSWTGNRDVEATTNGTLTFEMYDNTTSDWTQRAFMDMSGQFGRVVISADTGNGAGGFTKTNSITISDTSGIFYESTDGLANRYVGDYTADMTTDRHIPDIGKVNELTFYGQDGTITSNRTATGNSSNYFRFYVYNTDSSTFTTRGFLEVDDANLGMFRAQGDGAGNVTSTQSVDISNFGINVEDSTNERGLRYLGDYSTNGPISYGDRWIPDKGYVDSYADGVTFYATDGGWTGSRLVNGDTNGELQFTMYNTNSSTYTTKSLFNISQAGISYYYATGDGAGAETGLQGFVSDSSGMFFNNTINSDPVEYSYTVTDLTDKSIPSYKDTKDYTNLINESSEIPYVGDIDSIFLEDNHNYGGAGNGMFITDDGTQLFLVTASGEIVYRYILSTPWDISTETLTSSTAMTELGNPDLRGIHFNKDGTKMFFVSGSGYEYELSTSYDPTTRNTSTYYTWAHGKGTCWGIRFNHDGSKVFLLSDTNDEIYRYSLTTPWDLSTAGTEDQTFDISTQMTSASAREMAFDSQGLNLYVLDSNENVFQYKFSEAWSMDNLVSTTSDSVKNTNTRGMYLKPDTSRLYVYDTSNNNVYEYRFRINAKNISPGLPKGDLYIATPAATGTISAGTPVNICTNASTQGQGGVSAVNFTIGTNGRLTYTGKQARRFDVTAIISARCNQALRTLYFYIAKNGTVQNLSIQEQYMVTVNASEIVSVGFDIELDTNDYVEVYVDASAACTVTPQEMYFKARTQL